MRGNGEQQDAAFSYVSLEKRVPGDHPLRRTRAMVDEALRELSPQLEGLYSSTGRPSIAPEKLLRALYGKRSERLLMEALNYSLLFRWFVGLAIDEEVSNWRRVDSHRRESLPNWRSFSANCLAAWDAVGAEKSLSAAG